MPKKGPGFEARLRDQENKPGLALIPTRPLMLVGRVRSYSKQKYGDVDLWRKEVTPASERVSSALRHIYQWLDGEDLNPESGINHLAHSITQLMMLMETIEDHPETDDRWQK